MVVLKRKPQAETERRVEYDNVIELDDRKSFSTSQKESAEAGLYTQREAFINVKPREQVMPKINAEPKVVPTPKQLVSSKTKILLAAYIVIAVVLAAVVIGTGVAITEAGKRTSGLEEQLRGVYTSYEQQSIELDNLNNPDVIAVLAGEYNMIEIDNAVEVELVGEVGVSKYSETTNAFDKFRDFVSRIFS